MSRVAAGLPTNPRPRAARPSLPSQSAPRQQDEQRPVRSISTTRPRPTPSRSKGVPATLANTTTRNRSRDDYQAMRNVRLSGESSSTSSSASSEPSFWARPSQSQRSSRTTLPSDDKMEYKEERQEEHTRAGSQEESSFYSFRDIDTGLVWSRVTGAASTLTQEVSKAWAAGLGPLNQGDGDDEDDSHLVQVMRAYHLSKARTPAELPDWLFSDRERQQGGLLRSDPPNDSSHAKPVPSKDHHHPRDIHQIARPTHSDARSKSIRSRAIDSEETTPPPRSSGLDRLKTIRELRRNASNIRPMVKV